MIHVVVYEAKTPRPKDINGQCYFDSCCSELNGLEQMDKLRLSKSNVLH